METLLILFYAKMPKKSAVKASRYNSSQVSFSKIEERYNDY
jgi:hypothetical protein